MSAFVKFPSIENLWNLQKQAYRDGIVRTRYKTKVKLHGTNAGVRIGPTGVFAQSRNHTLTAGPDAALHGGTRPAGDNFGFASWVEQNRALFAEGPYGPVTVFGEWCGAGVQKNVALAQLPGRFFFVFAAVVEDCGWIWDPEALTQFVAGVPNTYVLPWHPLEFDIDWLQPSDATLETINAEVERIDQSCPVAKERFGVEGTGEGLVGFPQEPCGFSQYLVKFKGASHRVAGAKPAALKPMVSADAQAFALQVVTAARCSQFYPRDAVIQDIGPFIGAVCKDVAKECQAELEASGIDWKSASREVARVARTQFLLHLLPGGAT